MYKVYLILGAENVRLWESENPMDCDDIDVNQVVERTFKSEDQKQGFISGIALMGQECGYENYCFIDQDEYNFLIN